MSLRLKLFLIFGGLIGVLVLGQWLMVRALTQDIFGKFGEMAVSVGKGMASVFVFEEVAVAENGPIEKVAKEKISERRLFVRKRSTRTGDVEEVAADTVLVSPIPRDKPVLIEHVTDGEIEQYEYKIIDDETTRRIVKTDTQVLGSDNQHHYEIVSDSRHDVQVVDGVHPDELHIKLDRVQDANFLVLDTGQGGQTRIPLPRSGVSRSVQRISAYMLLGSLIIFAVGLIGAGYVAHRIARPLSSLAHTARCLGDGGPLGLKAPDSGAYPEIRQAIEAFNAMSVRLADLDRAERDHRRREHMSELGEIARGLAHSIRNPLNTLGLSLEQMAALSADPEQSRDLVESARKQIRRIDQWIRSFLALASEGKGERDPLDIGALIEDVVLEAIQDCMGRVKLDLVVENDLPKISGVAPELRAVVQALVVNAVEASPNGSGVWIRAERTPENGIRIEVLDRGSGIPETVRDRLFTPHVTTKSQGSGMGLFLAHKLATGRYRGRLSLEDADPSGTRAILELPQGNEYDENTHSGR